MSDEDMKRLIVVLCIIPKVQNVPVALVNNDSAVAAA
jgi:hypothetical protein